MKNIMMPSAISLALLTSPLVAGGEEVKVAGGGTLTVESTSTSEETAPATASAAETTQPVSPASLPATSLLHIFEFFSDSVLKFTGNASFDEQVQLTALNFLFPEGQGRMGREHIISELNKLPKKLVLNPEFQDALWYLMEVTTHDSESVIIIRTLAKAPARKWKLLAKIMRPFLSDIEVCSFNLPIRQVTNAFVSLPAEEWEEFAEIVRPFSKQPTFRGPIIKEFAKVPAAERKMMVNSLLPIIADIKNWDHIYNIIEVFASLPAWEWEELADVVRPCIKNPFWRDSIIKKFAGIPAAERKMMVNSLLPIIADIEDGKHIYNIIEVFENLPAREWKEFADAVRPCSKDPLWRVLIIYAFVKVPAESRTLFSNVVGPFVDTVDGYDGLRIVQEFVKVPARKLEALAKIVRPHVEAVRDSVKEELINVFNRVPETEWERVSNMVSRHIRDIDGCFEVREKILDDIVHGREVVIPPGTIRISPPLPKRLRSAADESSDEEDGLK